MKREEWRRAYEPLPDSLAVRVERTLSQLEEERIVKKHVLRTVIIVCVLVLLLGGTALASLGMRQSPRGERLTLPTLGPSGMHERLNCWLKKRRVNVSSASTI